MTDWFDAFEPEQSASEQGSNNYNEADVWYRLHPLYATVDCGVCAGRKYADVQQREKLDGQIAGGVET
jgi:hypothetical protein